MGFYSHTSALPFLILPRNGDKAYHPIVEKGEVVFRYSDDPVNPVTGNPVDF